MDKVPLSFKIFIAAFSSVALAFLFFFGDEVFKDEPEFLSINRESEDIQDIFDFNPAELSYDGSGSLDFLEGVSLDGYTSKELTEMVFVRISTGDNISKKIIRYTADTKEGRIQSDRILNLRNYKGPDIQLPDKMPSITMSNINHIAEIMFAENEYKVDDGFGNDVRNYVQTEVEKSLQNSSKIECTFILENEFGDRAVAKAEMVLSDVPAIIALTDNIVYLKRGGTFEPLLYVERAIDTEGKSIIGEVAFNSNLNTNVPGEYEAVYELRGQTVLLKIVVI